MGKLRGVVLLLVCRAGCGAWGQAGPSLRHMPDATTMDVSVGAFAQLTPNRVTNGGGTVQGASPSEGVLATMHQQVGPLLGYSVNFGYTRTTEQFLNVVVVNPGGGPTNYSDGSVTTDMWELSGSYVMHAPKYFQRFSPYGQFGAGILSFLPAKKNQPDAVNFRLAGLFGAGADYRLSRTLGVRLEYRGMIYKNPDFRFAPKVLRTSKNYTVTSEPTISLTYSFRAKQREVE